MSAIRQCTVYAAPVAVVYIDVDAGLPELPESARSLKLPATVVLLAVRRLPPHPVLQKQQYCIVP